MRSLREPYLIVPNRSDVERCRARAARDAAGAPRRLDRHVRRPLQADRRERRQTTAGRDRRAAQRCVVRRALAASPLNGLGRSARFGGFADALLATRRASSSPGCSTRTTSTASSRALYAAYRAELDRLGLWDRDLLRRRAAERVAVGARCLERRARLRVRVRGPDGRRVGAAAGTRRPQRGDGLDPVRARPRCLRVAAADDGRSEPRSRTGASRSCRRASTRSPSRRSHISSARSSARRSPSAPQIDGAVRFFEGAGARGGARARRRGGARADSLRRRRPSRSGSSARPRPLAGAARDGARHSRRSVRGRGVHAARQDARTARRS